MRFSVEFDTDGSAFENDADFEIACILRNVAARVEHGQVPFKVLDRNGNSIGRVEHAEPKPARKPYRRAQIVFAQSRYDPA